MSVRSIVWGEQHGLILDKKGRIFSMGRMISGVLGLSEKDEHDKVVSDPT
jgi:alpha-tubulin suppressor-like RCC1 family protein